MDISPTPPYLVIRGDFAAYRVQTSDDVSATIQALEEGCFREASCYDSTGGLWPITHATFLQPPSAMGG